jgi:hypothetical protein
LSYDVAFSINLLHEEFYLLGYNAMQSAECQPLLAMNFMLGLFFNSRHGSNMFLGNASLLSMEYTVLYPKQELLPEDLMNGLLPALATSFK